MLLKEILKYMGIDSNGGGVVLEGVNAALYNFSLSVFIFSVISLLCFFNILIYFIIVLYSDNSKFILDMCNKRP